ncbi:insulin-like growth factor-binding protein-related protein 1 [Copidosoma floridanum]|uniref:insulin-like growth factor-binding protein-related protein 1 n=1 Tax=Copidosoma floridanum TaxID=29053 RepID=UPI0006C96658|nr:insulin-like growth factor-binding protein-related protein 1 [Copidosoma floridanum]
MTPTEMYLVSTLLLVAVALASGTGELAETDIHAEGCYSCAEYRCPSDPSECLLGTTMDICGCCSQGVCARTLGESCWNPMIHELPNWRRNEGLCASRYECQLRDDLEPEDIPEATCVCPEEGPVCGSNNRTYATSCVLYEQSKRYYSDYLHLQHPGPCPHHPVIYSAPENVAGVLNHLVALGCEAKGFPLPDVFWEFHSADGERVLRLPYDELDDAVVNNSMNNNTLMRTSWLQLEHLRQHHVGTYHCVANNSIGQASAFSSVSIG